MSKINIKYSLYATTILVSVVLLLTPPATEVSAAVEPLNLTSSTSCINGLTRITVAWNNPNGATSFSLHRNPTLSGKQSWMSVMTGGSNVLSYNDAQAITTGTYQYQLQAIGGAATMQYSNIVSMQVAPCQIVSTPTPSPQPVPTTAPSLTSTASCVNGQPQVKLTWNNPTNASSFTLHRNPSLSGTKSWSTLTTVASQAFTDVKISSGLYQYQLEAVGGQPSPRYSSIASVTVPSCVIATPAATSTPPSPATTTPPEAKKLKWGAYAGWSDAEMKEFETQVVNSPDHMAAFVHWGNSNAFPTYMAPFTKAKNRTLIIFWEPSDFVIGGTVQPQFSYNAILAGNWDSYIRSFAAQAKAYGGPVILIPFSEMNGNWNPWSGTSNGNTPEKAVLGFRHLRNIFGDVPNVKFGWAPNSVSVPDTAANAIEKYYPGDSYVDYVGVDGFNFNNPWLTFDQVLGKSLVTISKYNKPMYIFSFASAQGTQKAAWITDAFTVQMKKYPLLEGSVWFNQNKEKDWRVWSDSASLAAFKNATK